MYTHISVSVCSAELKHSLTNGLLFQDSQDTASIAGRSRTIKLIAVTYFGTVIVQTCVNVDTRAASRISL